MPQAVPDSRPSRSGGTRPGIMLLKNTSAHCAPTAPSAKAASTGTMLEASAGLPNHKSADPTKSSAENPAIHGLRWPAASAIAPSAGESSAMISPAAAVANPHSAWPRVASPTIEAAKYGAYTKVVIRVKNGWTAHSNRIQPAIAAREAERIRPLDEANAK